jgi:hypothetical protein
MAFLGKHRQQTNEKGTLKCVQQRKSRDLNRNASRNKNETMFGSG